MHPDTQEQLLILHKARKEASTAHKLTHQTMMEHITHGFSPFKIGDKVWLESKHLKLQYESKKIAPKREGPFQIIKVKPPQLPFGTTSSLENTPCHTCHPTFTIHVMVHAQSRSF